MRRYSVKLLNEATDEREEFVAALNEEEVRTIEDLRAQHGADTAELMASAFVLQKAYRAFPAHLWSHVFPPEEILLS